MGVVVGGTWLVFGIGVANQKSLFVNRESAIADLQSSITKPPRCPGGNMMCDLPSQISE